MEEKIRILQLSPQIPLPADNGGRIGIYSILKEFAAQGAEVIFFSFTDGKPYESYVKELKNYCQPVLFEHSIRNTPTRIAGSVFRNYPLYLSKNQSPAIFAEMERLARNYDFDVIHADHSSMAPLALHIQSIKKQPIGLRLHNIEWTIWNRYAEILPRFNPKRLYIQRQAELLKKEECRLYSKMDACFAITEIDKKRALEMAPTANVLVASAGVDLELWNPGENLKREPFGMVLATNYDWVHNVDGLRWFIEKVLPGVREMAPDATLTVIGKNMPDWVRDYAAKGVNPVGYVPDVKPYFNKASVYISPLFVGGGIRLKILEAMAMELPVVATSVAAEGIEASRQQGLYVAQNADEFATAILNLFQFPVDALSSGINARIFIQENYTWKKNVSIMLRELRKLTIES